MQRSGAYADRGAIGDTQRTSNLDDTRVHAAGRHTTAVRYLDAHPASGDASPGLDGDNPPTQPDSSAHDHPIHAVPVLDSDRAAT